MKFEIAFAATAAVALLVFTDADPANCEPTSPAVVTSPAQNSDEGFSVLAVVSQRLSGGEVIDVDPGRLVELRVEVESPGDGFETDFEWLVFDSSVDWRQYENGKVFVCVAPATECEARLRIEHINWEKRSRKKEWRVFTIRARGPPKPPPVEPEKPDEPEKPKLAGPITSIVIRHADKLTADQAASIRDAKIWMIGERQKGATFQQLEFPPDAQTPAGDPDPAVAGWVAKIPEDASLPYVFVVQGIEGKEASYIHWQGELLSAEQLTGAIQEASQK